MDPQQFRASWLRAWQGLGAAGDGEAVLQQLLACYAQPHRRYHTLQHLAECLASFDSVRQAAEDPAAVEMALWFHDAVYDVARHDNEAQSARWAAEALRAAGAPRDRAERVASLVLATRHTTAPVLPDEQLLVDIDLSILGAPEARFAEYERQVREEYAFVPEPVFRERRRAILQSFLERRAIYGTAHFHGLLEEPARRNLQASVRSLAR